ncbi:hypothetical protein QJQ45_022875 [Haematococcus lacustris]|nr:hypothetical protein QJQ45_022875 [Haematococcus lacustris]
MMSAGGPELGQRPAAGAGATAQCVDQAAPGPQPPCLHEVCVTPFMDPETGSMLYIVQQQDVSARSELEQRLVALSEGQLALLHAMFPRHILERFALICCNSQGQSVALPSALPDLSSLATHHECVTIMFMDVVGFTTMSKDCSPEQVMGLLNELFSKLDDMLDRHGVMRVDTAGDCYIVCGGLLNEDEDGFMTVAKSPPRPAAKTRAARRVLNFTWEMMQAGAKQLTAGTGRGCWQGSCWQEPHAGRWLRCSALWMLRVASRVLMPHNGKPVMLRAGLHSGPVVSGLVGRRVPKFSLFGDTMNTASRMESTSLPGEPQDRQHHWQSMAAAPTEPAAAPPTASTKRTWTSNSSSTMSGSLAAVTTGTATTPTSTSSSSTTSISSSNSA